MKLNEFINVFCERENHIHQMYALWAKANGLNYNILAVLYCTYQNEGCTQKYICSEWGLPKQTVNTTCRDLMARGIIMQTQSASSKREISINFTDKGKAFAQPIVEELLRIEQSVLTDLGSERARQFLDLYVDYAKFIETKFTDSMNKIKEQKKG